MFDKIRGTSEPIFEVDGKTAKKNIDRVIDTINKGKTIENARRLKEIEKEMLCIKACLEDDSIYVSDYTEAMRIVTNTNFDVNAFIWEMQDKLEDAIAGYYEYEPKNFEAEQLLKYIDSLSSEIRARIVYKNNKDIVVLGAGVFLNEGDKEIIEKSSVVNDNKDDFTHRYMERKLFYILKKTGLNFHVCARNNKMFYIIFQRSEVDKWLSTKPYVECTYRYHNTYDIKYFVRNTPEEIEKFYCFASWKDGVESIVINGIELVDASSDKISDVIGKTLERRCYESEDINMFYCH
jgi:hypothetical protein